MSLHQQSFLLKVGCNSVIDLTTLLHFFPEDIIRNIASNLVMKIPSNDSRYQLLESHHRHNKEHRVQERIWNWDKGFRGYIITFSNKTHEFIIEWYRNEFISYQFKNTATTKYICDRCWFKLEDMNWRRDSTNYWQQFFIDGWLPNPNTTIL